VRTRFDSPLGPYWRLRRSCFASCYWCERRWATQPSSWRPQPLRRWIGRSCGSEPLGR